MKKITLVLFTLLTIIPPPNAWADGTETVNTITYSYEDTNHTATVTGCTNSNITKIIVPSSIEINSTVYTVSTIDANAFNGLSKLTTLVFSASSLPTLTSGFLGNCTTIKTVQFTAGSLPSFDTSFLQLFNNGLCISYGGIGYYHQGDWSDGYFTIGDGNNATGYSAYPNANETPRDIAILSEICGITVNAIQNNAFNGAWNIDHLNIPASIESISIFSNNKITSFTVDGSNLNYSSSEGVLFNKQQTQLISYPAGSSTTSYAIPNSVTTIGEYAFGKNAPLEEIDLGSVQEIKKSAFQDLSKLHVITGGNSLTSIGEGAFQNTGTHEDITTYAVDFTDATNLKTIGKSAFQSSGLTAITLPPALETITEKAFYECTNLPSIIIPSTVTTLGTQAFEGCSTLSSLTFNVGSEGTTQLSTISTAAFRNTALATITLPEGITTLKDNAFNPISNLANIYLPKSATNIYTNVDVSKNALPPTVTKHRTLNIEFEEGKELVTFCSTEPLTPEGLEVYTITDIADNTITLSDALSYIPENKPVLLKRTNTSQTLFYGVTPNSTPEVAAHDSKFIGTTTEITNFQTVSGYKYVLSGDQFVRTNLGTLPANRCYISIPIALQEGNMDAPADYFNFSEIGSGYTYVYKENGNFIKKTSNVGSARLSKDGTTMTLTVTPNATHYAYQTNIKVHQNVNAGTSRAPSLNLNDNTVELRPVDNADPSGTTTYTFDYVENATYEVEVDFQSRIDIGDGNNHDVHVQLKEVEAYSVEYNGTKNEPNVTSVVCDNTSLTLHTDYEPRYPTGEGDNKNKTTTAVVYIDGQGKYMGTYNKTFTITQRDISNVTATIPEKTEPYTFIYTGDDIKPSLTIIDGSPSIITKYDYTISYPSSNYKDVTTSDVKVTITGKGNYTGIKDISFAILPKEMTEENIHFKDNKEEYDYSGDAITPEFTISFNNGERDIILTEGTDYTYNFAYNTEAGTTAKVIVNFIGNYSGENVEKAFTIVDHGLPRDNFEVNFDSENEWTTYYSAENLSLEDYKNELEALVVTSVVGTTVNTDKAESTNGISFIPKETPVMLHRISGTKTSFNLKTCSGEEMPAGIIPSPLFIKTTADLDISTITTGKTFVLLNGKFTQTTTGTLKANRCYLLLTEVPEDVTTLEIGKNVNDITILNDMGAPSTTIGTAVENTKGTLTITPKNGFYVTADDISIIRNANAGSARAPIVDGGKMEVTAGNITNNADDNTSTYTFTYDYNASYQYQIVVQFQKSTELVKAATTITLDPNSYEYDKKVKQPQVTSVKIGDVTLTKDVDYVVTYPTEGNIEAGKGKVFINGIRKYTKELTQEFDITARVIPDHVTLKAKEGQTWVEGHELGTDDAQVIFTGSDIEVDVVDIVKDAENNETNIITADDYNITYNNNHKDASTTKVSITISNKGSNYQGSKPFSFTILPKEMTSEDVKFKDNIEEFEYTGEAIEPEFTITYNGISLVNGTDYDVAFENHVYAGEATATITFKGNYSGKVTKSFGIKDHLQPITVEFDNPDNQWNTYYYKENLALPTDGSLKAYVVTGHEGLKVNTKEVTFIPRNTAVLLFSESEAKKFDLTTTYNSKLDEATESSIDKNLFIGTETGTDISTVTGTKFVLLNDKFIQAAEGTVAPNRCYLVVTEPIEGVTELTINKAGNAIIYQEDGKATTANLGTASTSEPKDGKVTLTVSPIKGYYVNGAEDITVIKNANAEKGRAMQIDGGKVEVTAGAITDNKDYTSTYLFTYPFEQDCQYQITINFHKAANLSETGKYAVTFAPANYNGYEQKVEPTVTYDGATLKKDVDYMLTYPDADYTNAGKKTADIYGIRKFQNSLTRREFKIDPKNVNDITVETLEGQTWIKDHELGKTDAQVVYTGSEIKLNITDKIKDAEGHDVELLSAEQVDIIYKNNVNVGDASVTIKGKEVNYTGERPINYAIVAKEMTSEDIAAIPDQNYTGNEIKPALTIKYGNITLVEGEDKDYTVAYSNNINAGEATATVNFRGNYSGKDVKKTFKIVDVDETLTINFDSDNEWTTYYSSKNLTLTDNLKAYAVTGHNGKEVTTAELTFIPKETAVLLYSKSGEKTFNVETCSNETLPSDIVPDRNLFKGTLTNLNIASIAGTKFVLVDGQFVQTAEGTLAANRCYLVGSIEGVTTLTIGKGISEVITYEEGTETGAAGSARVITTPDENNNLTLVVTPKNGFYADQEHLKVVYSVNAGSARAPEVAGSEVALTPVEGYDDTSSEFRYTFPYTEGYFYQVTVNFQKCINLQAQGAQPTITLEEGTYVYDGTEKKPKIASVTIPVNGNTVTLTENKDFKVQEYQNNVNAGGTAKVIITGMNHYYNDYSKNFNIGQRDINLVKVEAIPDQTYTGQELTPALYVTDIVTINDQEVDLLNQIKDNGITIDDYTPEATDNINVGVAKVSLKATSINYTGIKSGITFNILPKDLNAEGNEPSIEPIEDQYYTGKPVEPALVIKDGELTISEDNYTVEYSNNVKEGTATAKATFKNNYKGTAVTTFVIKFKEESHTLNVDFGTKNEWTTYYSPIDLQKVEGVNIYVVTGLNKGQGIDLKTEEVNFIPKNIGVLLQRTDMSKTVFTGMTMPSDTKLENVTPDTELFRGSATGIEDLKTIEGIKYILLNDRFVEVVEGSLPANRCYVFISNEDDEGIAHVVGEDADGIVIQEEGTDNKSAGMVTISGPNADGYKTITVTPASVLYATKDEIQVVRSIKNTSAAASRRAPGIDNTPVEIIPVNPTADPSGTTQYRFKYDSNYHYQVTVDFQKRINLSDVNTSHPVVTLKAEDIQYLEYDGKPKTPAVEKVTCNGITVDPSNYDVSYENNTNAGRPRVIITGKRFLMGSTHAEFNIGKRNFSNVTVKEPIPDQEYNDGAPIVFKGLVLEDIVDGENIVQTTDYTIVCNDTEIGSAKVSFLPANNYEGSGKGPFSFNIIPATGINQIVIDEMEGQWFDLNGQRIEGRPTQKGVYILRDKKQRSIKVRIK